MCPVLLTVQPHCSMFSTVSYGQLSSFSQISKTNLISPRDRLSEKESTMQLQECYFIYLVVLQVKHMTLLQSHSEFRVWMYVNLFRLTCTYGLHQLGVMLGSEQGMVVAWIFLKLVLSSTDCHPDQGPMLIGYTLTYISLY